MSSPDPAKSSRPARRWLWTFLTALFLVILLTITFAYVFSYPLAKAWMESPGGQRTASAGLSRAIKVDGRFEPLHLDDWTIRTDSFTSTGWPGEAIGGLNAYGIRAELDPAAYWKGAYRVKGIQIARAQITLLPPVDALKRPVPPKKPRPWYALFLPSRFECGPIIAQSTALDFSFQNDVGHIRDARVQADLIGKDLNYTATSGVLEFPYLPPLRIVRLEMLVTRPVITVKTAQLVGLDPADPARLTLQGSIGMRENKEIDASVDVVDMPIEQILPADLAPLIHGRASGKLVWKRDASGQQVYSQGEVSISGASIKDLSVFKQLTLLHGNPDLQNFTFDQADLKFILKNGVFSADLTARSIDRFALKGKVSYELKTKHADLNLAFTDLPLRTWLPTEFKPRYSGTASAAMKWSGQLATIKDSAGTVVLNLDGAHIHDPLILRKLISTKGFRTPDEIDFKTAQLDFAYQDQTFYLTRSQFELPGIISMNATGMLNSPDYTLQAYIFWSGLTLQNWLPPELAQQFSGDINGGVKLRVQQWKVKDGAYSGDIELMHGKLKYTSVQSMLARFVNDRRLLEIPLTRAKFTYDWSGGVLGVTNIDLRGGDDFAVRGDLRMSESGKLSGTLWIGTSSTYVRSLMGLGDAVFFRNDDGLRWAKVAVSGTARKPEQDLSAQLMAQLKKHPGAIFGLSGKMASWYIGNLFGEEDAWKRPLAK